MALVKFSPYNPIQFVEQNAIIPDKFGYAPFGKALHKDSVKYWQDNTPWAQPWNRNHLVNFEVHVSYSNPSSAYTNVSIIVPAGPVYPDGLVLENFSHDSQAFGIISDDDEPTAQFYSYLYSFTFGEFASLATIDEVQVRVLVHETDGTEQLYISNPISLATKHEDVSFVEYNQQTNTNDTVFEQLKPRFGYPFYSKGLTSKPGGVRTVYNDQNQALQMLYGKAVTVFTLDLGGFEGLPETEMRLLNTIFTEVENARVDGTSFTKDATTVEITAGEGKSRQWGRATFQMEDESDSYTHGKKTYLLWERPVAEGEAYAIMNLGVTDNFATIWDYVAVFDDATAESDYVTAFNTQAASKNLDCEMQEIDGIFYLVNTGTQKVYSYSPVVVFGSKQILSVTITGGLGATCQYKMGFPKLGTRYLHVVSWGATSGDDEGVEADQTLGLATATKSFAAGTHTVRIFHKNDFTEWWSVGNSFGGQSFKITDVTGETSSTLAQFRLQNHDLSSHLTFDLSFLAPAKNTLKTLIIENSKLKGFTSGWASSLVSGTYKPFKLLVYYSLGTNEWTVANLNAFVIEVRDSTKWNWYQNMFIKGNSPLAAPTGTALAHINDWKANWGWNIQHD